MYSIVESPVRYPLKCRSCGVGPEGDRTFWVDFGEDDNETPIGPDFATVYLCSLCFTAIASENGFASPLANEDKDARIEDLETELFEARVKADGLENGLYGLLKSKFIDPTSSDAIELVGFLEAPEFGEELESDEGDGVAVGEGEITQ